MNKRPNILHIITHDTGRHLECYGAEVNTPHINKIAQEGVRFTNYYCVAPQCSPSRATMFSGLYPHNNGMIGLAHRGFSLKEGIPYLPRLLKEQGYRTFLFGIQHEARMTLEGAKSLGYERYLPEIKAEEILPHLTAFLENSPPQPFFISVGFIETHRIFPTVDSLYGDVKVPPFLPDVPEVRKDIVGLNILVERVDRVIGEIDKTLEKTGLKENTLLIITTDHGIAFPGAKATFFDPGIEIFLIMRGPGMEEGKEVDALLSNLDFTPTILDYLNLEIPKSIQGKSFYPVIKGEVEEINSLIFLELTYHAGYDPMRGIRTKKFKYIRSFEIRPWFFPPNVDDSPSKDYFYRKGWFDRIRPFEFLFDLEKDPLEKENLSERKIYRDTIKKFREEMFKWMENTQDPLLNGPVSLPSNARVTPPWHYSPNHTWGKESFNIIFQGGEKGQ